MENQATIERTSKPYNAWTVEYACVDILDPVRAKASSEILHGPDGRELINLVYQLNALPSIHPGLDPNLNIRVTLIRDGTARRQLSSRQLVSRSLGQTLSGSKSATHAPDHPDAGQPEDILDLYKHG